EIQQNLGESAHADPAHADEMYCTGRPYHRPPSPPHHKIWCSPKYSKPYTTIEASRKTPVRRPPTSWPPPPRTGILGRPEGGFAFMLKRFVELLTVRPESAAPAQDRVRVAVCVILVEAAYADEEFTDAERAHIRELMTQRYGMAEAE